MNSKQPTIKVIEFLQEHMFGFLCWDDGYANFQRVPPILPPFTKDMTQPTQLLEHVVMHCWELKLTHNVMFL